MSMQVDNDNSVYQIFISNADDVNDDLNGLYKGVYDEDKLPQITPKKAKKDTHFIPNFMFYRKSHQTSKEYAIFIIPSLPSMNLHKPTWVISQIGCKEIVHFYAASVNFDEHNAMKGPINCDWQIVGDDDEHCVLINVEVIKIAPFNVQRKNFSAMFSKKNKLKMMEEIKKENDPQCFDVDDVKATMVEMVGYGNIVIVTSDINELTKEWNASELGPHDNLECYLGCKGKVVDIEEDDDSIQVEWSNMNTCWIPVKACWITWKDKKLTAPKYFDNEANEDDAKLLQEFL